MNKNKTIIAAIILLFLSVLTYYFVYKKNKYLSPLGTGQILSSASVLSHDTKIIGFLPYWNLKNEASIDFSVLDELIYFGLAVDDKGNFIKMTDTGYEDPGWTWFKSDSLLQIKNLAHKKNKQILFSVNALNNELINSIVSDPKTQDRLIKNIIDTLKQYEFDGVNVDFEYVYSTNDSYFQKESFTSFIKKLSESLKNENKNYILSSDFYANALINDNVYSVKELSRYLDEVIIMAYDFHRPVSDTSGPVAPLKSTSGRSIIETIQASLNKVELKKLILGIPLYGYEWQTYSEKPATSVIPQSGALASYGRVHELISEKKLDVKWDYEAMSPYLVFKENDGRIKQIYYENLESLSLKYQLVKQVQMGGVAFWAIGYEGEFNEVWKEARKKLKT